MPDEALTPAGIALNKSRKTGANETTSGTALQT